MNLAERNQKIQALPLSRADTHLLKPKCIL